MRSACCLIAALLLSLSCQSKRLPAQRFGVLDFEFAGCARVRRGPICELTDERKLTFWVKANGAPSVIAGGVELPALEAVPIAGGFRSQHVVPVGSKEVVLHSIQRRAVLRVAEHSEPALLARAKKLRSAGNWQQAKALLERELSSLSEVEVNRGRALLARLELSQGHYAQAARGLKQSARKALEDGLLSEAALDTFARAYVLTNKQYEFDQVSHLLDTAALKLSAVPKVQSWLAYYRGLLAQRLGDTQEALLQFRRAALLADRLDLTLDGFAARKELAASLFRVGRRDEAIAVHEDLADVEAISACHHAGRLVTLTWFQLASGGSADRSALKRTLTQVEAALIKCPDAERLRNHRLNLTFMALDSGHLAGAEKQLALLANSSAGARGRFAMWEAHFRGEVSSKRGRVVEAASHYEKARALASAAGIPAQEHTSWLAQGRLYDEAGRPAMARIAYLQAEGLAQRLVRSVPLGEGQHVFALQLEGAAQGLVGLYLRAGQQKEALAMARGARQRLLAADWRSQRIEGLTGEARQTWKLAVAEYRAQQSRVQLLAENDWQLSARALASAHKSRELHLQKARNALGRAYTVLGGEPSDVKALATRAHLFTAQASMPKQSAELLIARDNRHWHAFLTLRGELRVFNLGPFERLDQAPSWAKALRPVFEMLRGRAGDSAWPALLRVALHPDVQRLDLHAMLFEGQPMLVHMPVAYVLGATQMQSLGGRPVVSKGHREAPSKALEPSESLVFESLLVVGDPNGDLPMSRQEALSVASQVRAKGTVSLFNSDVTKARVLSLMPAQGLFHFSGHAEYGGVDGITSALRLAGGDRLRLGDALLLEPPPRFAVLAACEAAGNAKAAAGGLTLAHAFLAAGAEVVVAPTRSVSDAMTRNFTDVLYTKLEGSSVLDWAQAVREAALALSRQRPEVDWSSFRLLLP